MNAAAGVQSHPTLTVADTFIEFREGSLKPVWESESQVVTGDAVQPIFVDRLCLKGRND
jgi:hypothetical protein